LSACLLINEGRTQIDFEVPIQGTCMLDLYDLIRNVGDSQVTGTRLHTSGKPIQSTHLALNP
jgi:hypothetical protein